MTRIDSRHTYLSTVPPPSLQEWEEEELSTADTPVAEEDFLHFGREWPKISAELSSGELLPLVELRKQEISAQKESLRLVAQDESLSFQKEVSHLFDTGSLQSSKLGGGGVYFLCDAVGTPRFVVKPSDEAILCLNNPKHRANPFNDPKHRLRDYLPLYQAPPTEAAVFQLAEACGIATCTPETHLMILSSPLFYDIIDHSSSHEKLCSVQRFIPDSIDLTQAMHEWFEAGLETTQPLPIDQDDYEEVLLLLWLIFDGDGHSSNFRIYFKGIDEHKEACYGIKKIDNGLSLPESNCYLLNYLGYLANARKAPSENLLKKIRNIDETVCQGILAHYGLAYATTALLERIEVLKEIASRSPTTLEAINLRLELLCLPNGKAHALSPKSIEEITAEVMKSSSTQPHPPSGSFQSFGLLRA